MELIVSVSMHPKSKPLGLLGVQGRSCEALSFVGFFANSETKGARCLEAEVLALGIVIKRSGMNENRAHKFTPKFSLVTSYIFF